MKLFLSILLVLVLFTACQKENDEVVDKSKMDPESREVVVDEVLEVSSYTYALVDDYGDKLWVAAPKQEVVVGETYYFKGAMEMKNFTSEELDKTFDSVLFIQELRTEPYLLEAEEVQMPPGSKKSISDKMDLKMDVAEGGISVAELYQNKDEYSGKMVKLRGKVTKFNAGIMGRNWVHIQDGSEYEGQYDITLTTEDVFEVGTVVEIEGAVALNKDFGFGYKYDVLLENGKKLSVEGT